MRPELPCEALRLGRCLEVRYDGYVRIVEVHVVGFSRDGHGLMRVWQIRGGSVSGEPAGWKLLRLEEVVSYGITSIPSKAPRPGYSNVDPAMPLIECQV